MLFFFQYAKRKMDLQNVLSSETLILVYFQVFFCASQNKY